jgi:hypothetical protein
MEDDAAAGGWGRDDGPSAAGEGCTIDFRFSFFWFLGFWCCVFPLKNSCA